MKKFFEFDVGFIPYNPDMISGLLWQMDITGIEESNPFLKVFAEEGKNVTEKEISRMMESLRAQNLIERYSVSESEIEDKNWNEIWESQIGVIEVSNRIAIKPTFKEYQNPENKIIIELDPKMSFGTGEHPTTQMMLRLIEKHTPMEGRVLDVGSGTAVLAIAAVKLGAASAVAVDNDEWCSLNGKENAERNNCAEAVEVILGEISDSPGDDFDLVAANINRNILLEIAEQIALKTKTGGIVLLSGFLENDEQIICDALLPQSLNLIDKLQHDEWLALAFNKQN